VATAAAAAALRCGMTAAASAATAVSRRRHRSDDDAVIVMEYAGERNLLSIINDRRQALPYSRRVRSVLFCLHSSLLQSFYYNARKVCLSVCLSLCLSAPFSAFPVARWLTLTAAFESLGLSYVPSTLPPPICPLGQPEGVGLSCRVFFTR